MVELVKEVIVIFARAYLIVFIGYNILYALITLIDIIIEKVRK